MQKQKQKRARATRLEPLRDGAHDDDARDADDISVHVGAKTVHVAIASSLVAATRVGGLGLGLGAPLGPSPSRRSVLARRSATGTRIAGRVRGG